MPKVCPACDGGRTVLKAVELKWWERLLGRPDLLHEGCLTCNGTGRVPGTPEEEAAYAARQAAEQEAYAAKRAASTESSSRRRVSAEPLTDKDKMLIFGVLGVILIVFVVSIASFGVGLAMKYTLRTIGVIGLLVGAFGKNQTAAGVGALAITASWFFF